MLENAGKRLCRSWRESCVFACVRRAVAVAAVALAAFGLTAAPVPLERVQRLARGVAASVQLSFSSGASVSEAQTVLPAQATVSAVAPPNSDEAAFYVVDRGAVGGFVVMSADDRLDPVLVIAPTGKFDPKPGTPLYDMLCRDIGLRLDVAEAEGAAQSEGWRALLDESDPVATSVAYASASSVDDVRVAPLVQSKWSQSIVYDDYWDEYKVYNYYTPNNYVCGCVATAGAQIMRHHEYPKTSVTAVKRTCYVDGAATAKWMKGGVYDWVNMPLDPSHTVMTATSCEAIGKLCYDMGVACYMSWGSWGSGTSAHCLQEAFTQVFGYANAMAWYQDKGTLPDKIIQNALLANFDAGYPVEISIQGPSSAHSIVADGYGYQSGSLYVHLNFGWGGSDDAWYHLPDIGTSRSYNLIDGAVYNVFPNGTGDLLTGRVVDAATRKPIAGATVQVLDDSAVVGATTTSAAGIYALRLRGGKTYSVVASAAGATPSEVMSVYLPKSETIKSETRYYDPGTGSVGNSWGNDIWLATAVGPGVPAAPTGVSATDGTSTDYVKITWKETLGATEYEVWRAKNSTKTTEADYIGRVSMLEFIDTEADQGVSYTYWVKAASVVYTSGFSAYDKGWRSADAPTGVTASDGTTVEGVVVTWNSVQGAVKYEVWRNSGDEANTNGAARVFTTADGSTCTYTDTSAKVDVRYWYWVRTVSSAGTGVFSEVDDGYRAMPTPTNVKAADGASYDYVRVTWGAVTGAKSYDVRRIAKNDLAMSVTNVFNVTGTTLDDTNAVPGKIYTYWVRSVSSLCASEFAGPDDGYRKLQKINDVAAGDGTSLDAVELTWTWPEGAEQCHVWRSTGTGVSSAEKIGTVSNGLFFADTTARYGVKYYYWVNGEADVVGEMGTSNDGWRDLLAPTDIQATKGVSTTEVQIRWGASPDATKYQIWRGTSPEPSEMVSVKEMSATTELKWEDTLGTAGELYYYSVRAGGTGGWGQFGTPDTGYKSLQSPTGVTAEDGKQDDRVKVQWNSVTGASHYRVYRRTDSESGEYIPVSKWQAETSFTDLTCEGTTKYYYYVKAAVDEQGTRASVFSGGDSGYARVGGHAILPVDFGGGITWPVYGNGDGTTTTNAIAISALEGGRLRFHGVQGEVGAMTTVQARVKTALDSAETYTVEAGLKIVEPEMAELDLSSVWGTQPSLFVLGIATEKGKPLP